MGCWNQTCGLSNLAIRHGDPVTVFLLEPSTEELAGGGFCYSDDIFVPVFIPIHAKYNDYGSIENIQPGSEMIFDYFQKEFNRKQPRTWIEEDKYDKSLVTNLEELVKIIERKRFEGTEGRWGFIMFHTHIYQSMIDRIASRMPYNQERTFGELTLLKMKNLIHERKTENDLWFDRDQFRGVTGMMSSVNSMLLETCVERFDVSECAELFTDIIMFKEVMALMRKAWMPQPGQGSQGSEYALHLSLTESVKQHILHVKKEWGEDNGEELEPDFGEETLFWH